MQRTRCLLMAMIFAAAEALAWAGGCPELVGRWGYGAARTVAHTGNLAVFNSGSYLLVADIANPASVPVVGRVLLPDEPMGVAASGSYAFVSAEEFGLRIIDLSLPVAPYEIGHLDLDGYSRGLAVRGNIVYLANGWHGMRVIDVTDPANPALLGTADTPWFATDVAVNAGGTLAAVSDSTSGVRLIDISNPANPVEVGFLDTPGSAEAVAFSGNLVVVADSSQGVRVIDASSPASPVELGSFTSTAWSFDVAVAGNLAYVAYGVAGLVVLDIATPGAPVEVGDLPTLGFSLGIDVAGTVALLADREGGLRAVNVANAAAPVQTFDVVLPDTTLGVAIDGDYAFLANAAHGLRVIRISDPASPGEVGSPETPGRANAVVVQDHVAFVADGSQGLRIFDVTAPTSPVARGSYMIGGDAYDLAAQGSHVFMLDSIAGLEILDVGNLDSPTLAATLPLPGTPTRIALSGALALVASLDSGLHVIDIADPTAPVLVSTLPVPAGARSVAATGNLLYVGDGLGRVRVVDVSNPAAPVEIGSPVQISNPVDLEILGLFLLAAEYSGGITVLSIADPTHPEIVGDLDTPGTAVAVASRPGGLVAVADSETGTAFFDLGACPLSLCVLTCNATATPGIGLAPLTVQLGVAATASQCGGSPAYDWDFGDGAAHSTLEDPVHLYTSTGIFPWSVTVNAGTHQTACSGTVTVAQSPPRHFDLGTPASPLAAGYERVTHNTTISGVAGFGWSSGVLASRDRATGSDLTRDFVFSPAAAFDVLLPAGRYDVAVTMGDATTKHDQVGVFLEAWQADTVTTNAGQFVTRTHSVQVGDGVLNLAFQDLGGTDPNAVINAIVVTGGTPLRFDFGTPTSPVAAGYAQVTQATSYDERRGHGWLSGTIIGRDRTSGSDLFRDLNFTPLGTFAVDLANGFYDLIVTVGDQTTAHDQMGILVEGTRLDSVSTAAGAFSTRLYRVKVADGQLTLTLDDLGGTDANVVINALEIYGGPTGAPGTIPAGDVPKTIADLQTVTSTIELAAFPGQVTDINVTVDISHTNDADIRAVLVSPGGVRVTLLEGTGAAGGGFVQTTLDDEAATSITSGTAPFTGTFQPLEPLAQLDGEDPNGNWGLEITDTTAPNEGILRSWSLTVVTAVLPPPQRIDFGTPASPVATGYTRATHTTAYTPALGHGWLAGTIQSRDRTTGSDRNRDFCFTPQGTFVLDLPAGTYDVTVVSGDATIRHDLMAIEIEGHVAGTVTAQPGQFPATTVRRQVLDGQLTVLLKDNGGTDPNVVINTLEVTAVLP